MERYRIREQLRGTVQGEFHRVIDTIPAGSLVALIGPVVNGSNQVEVLWEGRSFWLFEVDFRDQVTQLTEEASAPAAKLPSHPQQEDSQSTVRVRRFNAAGRELF
jgi:hypothetical protein